MATLTVTVGGNTLVLASGETVVINNNRKGIAAGRMVLETGTTKSVNPFMLETAVPVDTGTAALAEPGAGTVTITGYAPTAEGDTGTSVNVTPPAGTITLAGLAPTFAASDHQTAEPGAGAVTITGLAPTFTAGDDKTATPPAGAVTITGLAPTFTAGDAVVSTPPAGAVTITGLVPVVTTTDHQTAEPGVGTVTITGQVPAVITVPDPIILSVVPGSFDTDTAGRVITTANLTTAGATVKIGGIVQSVTGTTANTITITTERGTTSLGNATLEVIAA
jgi:hypothetical protein